VIVLSDRMTQSVLSRRRGERLSLRTISHQKILRASKAAELYRPQIYRNWYSPSDGRMFSFCQLDGA